MKGRGFETDLYGALGGVLDVPHLKADSTAEDALGASFSHQIRSP